MERRALNSASIVFNRRQRNALAFRHFILFWLVVCFMLAMKVVVTWLAR